MPRNNFAPTQPRRKRFGWDVMVFPDSHKPRHAPLTPKWHPNTTQHPVAPSASSHDLTRGLGRGGG